MPRSFILTVCVGVILSSLVWTWVAIRKMREKSIVPELGQPDRIPVLAVCLAATWVAMSLSAATMSLFQPAPAREVKIHALQSSCMKSAVIAIVLAVICSWGKNKSNVGTSEIKSIRAVSLGVLGFLASILPLVMIQAGIVGLYQLAEKPPAPMHPLLDFMKTNKDPTAVLWVSAAAVVAAPLLEELVYRVVIQTALREKVGRYPAILITAVIFGYAHGWPNMIGIFALAIILGYLFDRTNNYLVVVTTHAAFNLGNLVLLMLQNLK